MLHVHNKIDSFIKDNKLIDSGNELVLGISGGADSMMLLHYFYTNREYYGVSLKVAHIHHGIRETAELDANLVEDVCNKYGIPFFRHNCNIYELSKQTGMSEEEVGRQERYTFFISLLNENGKIVTAHNMNDQAETMMMRFFRGTDVKGLGGIPPKRDNTIIRPLLCITRKEIEQYCQENNVIYRNDETNFVPIYTRNKIRLECTPYIEESINPSLVRVLGEHSKIYREQEEFLKQYVSSIYERIRKKDKNTIVLNYEKLITEHTYIQRRIILLAIEELADSLKNITSKHVEICLKTIQAQSGKKINLPYQIVMRKIYDEIVLIREEKDINSGNITDIVPDEKKISKSELASGEVIVNLLQTNIKFKIIPNRDGLEKRENLYTKYIDYGKIKSELQIRIRRPSDYMAVGIGTKKLKKIFNDDKIPVNERDTLPLIANGSEIVWITGGRLNTDYYITPNTTEVLEIQIANERE